MALGAQPTAERETGEPGIRAAARPGQAAEARLREKPVAGKARGATSRPAAPAPPLPGRAGHSAPLPSPAPQNVRGGAQRSRKLELGAGAARPPEPHTLPLRPAPASGSTAQTHDGAPARRPPSGPAGGRGARAARWV